MTSHILAFLLLLLRRCYTSTSHCQCTPLLTYDIPFKITRLVMTGVAHQLASGFHLSETFRPHTQELHTVKLCGMRGLWHRYRVLLPVLSFPNNVHFDVRYSSSSHAHLHSRNEKSTLNTRV